MEILHNDPSSCPPPHTLQKSPEDSYFCGSQSQTLENRAVPLVFSIFWFWDAHNSFRASSSFLYSAPPKQVLTDDFSIPMMWIILPDCTCFSCVKILFNEDFQLFLFVTCNRHVSNWKNVFSSCFWSLFWFVPDMLIWTTFASLMPLHSVINLMLFLSPTHKMSSLSSLWGTVCDLK